MKKIAIVTLNGYFNYGNRLQNYALQETIKLMGFEVETIINCNKPKNSNYKILRIIDNLINKSPNESINKLKYKVWAKFKEKEFNKSEEVRTDIFKKFTHDYIKETNYTISDDAIPIDLSSRYHYFVTGSDQVWNPDYINGSSINFLTFSDKDKRISYAPSFGVSVIPEEMKESYKEWIKGIGSLSVREDDGSKIIKDLTGIEAPVLVDPTLLLTKEKWLSISKEAINKPKEKYLLTYFLGGIPKAYKKQISKIIKDNNLKIINLGDIREKETYRTGPSEFIDYINSCSIFCTDSFHGAAFSILLEKPFIVFERQGLKYTMVSRINTLLDKFTLENRKAENISWEGDIFNIDYSDTLKILQEERSKSINYLKNALKIEDAN